VRNVRATLSPATAADAVPGPVDDVDGLNRADRRSLARELRTMPAGSITHALVMRSSGVLAERYRTGWAQRDSFTPHDWARLEALLERCLDDLEQREARVDVATAENLDDDPRPSTPADSVVDVARYALWGSPPDIVTARELRGHVVTAPTHGPTAAAR
jgi:hypothetical protein